MASNTLQPACAPANAPTRRGFIGGALLAPALAALPVAAASPRAFSKTAWRAAADRYWQAFGKADHFYRHEVLPASNRHDALCRRRCARFAPWPPQHQDELQQSFAAVSALEDRLGELTGVQMKAGEAIVFLPAPDAGAFAEKVRIFLIETEDCSVDKTWLKAMAADAARLSAERWTRCEVENGGCFKREDLPR